MSRTATPLPHPVRIVLADDHAVVRRGLRLVLESEPDLTVVAEAGDGRTAVKLAMRERADVAVLDLSMPVMSGLQATRELARLGAPARVVILSMHSDEQYQVEARRAGAAAYVLKAHGRGRLVEACRAAYLGEPFSATERRALPDRHATEREAEAESTHLTRRERQVLGMIADGHTSKEIAEALVISPRTVERHRENLLRKLGLRNRVELARYAIRMQLLEP
jgi:DNA-binding NarL/FixJ family response regulator